MRLSSPRIALHGLEAHVTGTSLTARQAMCFINPAISSRNSDAVRVPAGALASVEQDNFSASALMTRFGYDVLHASRALPDLTRHRVLRPSCRFRESADSCCR